MKWTRTEELLVNEMARNPVIDAHEHLPLEAIRIAEPVDALVLFRQYTRLVMFSAGLEPDAFRTMHDPEADLDERFRIFDSCIDLIRHSGPARAAYLALHRFYHEKDLTRDNFETVTARMRQLYKPGLYQRVLQETCGICAVLQNAPLDETDFGGGLLRPVPSLWGFWDEAAELGRALVQGTVDYTSPDEYVEAQTVQMRDLCERGAVGFKMHACPYAAPDRAAATGEFRRLRAGDLEAARTDKPNPLVGYLIDQLLSAAGRLDRTVTVHTGVWDDFRQSDPKEMIPHIRQHPEVRFDLLHMGLPYVRDSGRIGANFANVWLNLAWAHTLSPAMAVSGLDEWLDQVALNKITAFGGDVRWPVEKVYGHLMLAREVVATVLGRRVDRGLMTTRQAMDICKQWFHGTPSRLYLL